jgi:hypothetical protein
LSYETRRAAEVELPKGTVRLGRKAADGTIVPVVTGGGDSATAAE